MQSRGCCKRAEGVDDACVPAHWRLAKSVSVTASARQVDGGGEREAWARADGAGVDVAHAFWRNR